MDVVFPLKIAGTIGLAGGVVSYIPDIMITDNYNNSDEFKQLTFHEMGHALHAMSVGKLWWSELVTLEILHNSENNLPYGDGNFTHSDMVALTESWAEFIAMRYTHMMYSVALGNFWNDENEDLSIFSNYIPEGLHHDLVDPSNNGNNSNEPIINGNHVDDAVSGFSIFTLFNALGNYPTGVRNFSDFETNLINNRGSNSVTQINTLFNSYAR
jgi:hypothetical protein